MPAPIAPGTLLNSRYCLIGAAGQGRFGQTYLARDQKRFNELCVLKEFTPMETDPAAIDHLRQRFNQEIAPLFELQHPQLPQLRAMVVQEQRLYWAREYVEGKSYGVLLDERLAQGQGFSEAEVIQFLLQVLPILTYLHNRGVVHRNLTLDTLILRQQDQLPVLINFGLVQDLVVRLQLHPVEAQDALGQWGYIPPEQLSGGTVYPNSDLYALAMCAIALLAGKSPEHLFDKHTQRFEWERHITIHPTLAKILRQLLQPNPQKRFASAAQVMQVLEPLLPAASLAPANATPEPQADTQLNAPAAPVLPPRKRVRKRKRDGDPRASAALAIGVAMLIAVVAWKVFPHRAPVAQPKPSATPVAATPQASPVVPATAPAPSATPSSTPAPPAENDAAQTALRNRRRNLGIDFQFFTNLVDETFYMQNPQVRSQKLGGDLEQNRLRGEWNTIANRLMDQLETLKPETRAKLGSYRRETYDQWLVALGEAGAKNSPRLDALADSRFFQLFPDMKGKPLNPRTYGQVWYAIAEDQLAAAKAQKR